jgi:hypothetical protein
MCEPVSFSPGVFLKFTDSTPSDEPLDNFSTRDKDASRVILC